MRLVPQGGRKRRPWRRRARRRRNGATRGSCNASSSNRGPRSEARRPRGWRRNQLTFRRRVCQRSYRRLRSGRVPRRVPSRHRPEKGARWPGMRLASPRREATRGTRRNRRRGKARTLTTPRTRRAYQLHRRRRALPRAPAPPTSRCAQRRSTLCRCCSRLGVWRGTARRLSRGRRWARVGRRWSARRVAAPRRQRRPRCGAGRCLRGSVSSSLGGRDRGLSIARSRWPPGAVFRHMAGGT
mmetsp:Transcript_14534/g.43116  ORF Transcript_14534/g.43116 Transcript_14534/m.43116 type:complete len:241 (+) Transcript_14534:1125-1847(+)